MLNYPLTEFSLKELHILSNLISEGIDDKQCLTRVANMVDGTVGKRLSNKYQDGLSELREMHVRVLTAIDIVKQKETTNAN